MQIDYGEPYEQCRLRNGYSRFGFTSSEQKMKAKLDDDTTAINDFANLSVNQAVDCLSFLEKLYAKSWKDATETNHKRALLATFALDARVNSIIKEFSGNSLTTEDYCDGGISTTNMSAIKGRLETLISTICGVFPGKKLKEVVLSMKLLSNAASERLRYAVQDSTLSWRTLRKELCSSKTSKV
jgi:hypothetical protein